ncbi:MAG: nitroreductase family protein [Spirochaetaceae bacterium]|jgi:nitroreductase|nr:nitroreductase family protein [Spirochaetaceae bacterium]
MDTIVAMKTRRSVRTYKNNKIDKEVLLDILDCARLAPSGHNKQPWIFVIVTDPSLREKISQQASYGRFIKDSGACIAVFCDPKSETYMEDAFAATENILIAAHAYELGSCWVNSFRKEHSSSIKSLLNTPDTLELMSLIALGEADIPAMPKKKTLEEIIIWESF